MIWVSGVNVSIKDWGKIVSEVKAMKLKDDDKVADELLKRVKASDFAQEQGEGVPGRFAGEVQGAAGLFDQRWLNTRKGAFHTFLI